jgi:hypothetical protein
MSVTPLKAHTYDKQMKVGFCKFAGKKFWPLLNNIYEYLCCYNRCLRTDVKGSRDLWCNIYEYMFVLTVAMVMILNDFEPYGIIFTTMCVYYFKSFP